MKVDLVVDQHQLAWEELRDPVRFADHRAGFATLMASWPTEGRARVDEFVEKVLPDLREIN